jgi:diaminohydroxyphosphoribosylaminopyrimidine deaminase/5-amino-6-(5-phosphoribosylamino)uracil reductase
MGAALSLAARNLGQTWPNPAVGCVIVDAAGHVVGRGSTQPSGRPHAETEALAMAGERAKDGTAYVTLEPCSHHGKTPPCADALIAAGIARCVAAIEDPDPRVSGRGFAALKQAGIAVETGLLAERARDVNAGFLKRIATGRPFVALKLATSLDGRIATRSGESRWITGEPARAFGHMLRASHDAIAVGSGTVLIDDPALTCRLKGLEDRSPVRLVFDRRGRLPSTARLLHDNRPTWVVCNAPTRFNKASQYIEITPNSYSASWLSEALGKLGAAGLTRILLEGGATLAGSFVRERLVDRVVGYQAPALLGAGPPVLAEAGVATIADTLRLQVDDVSRVGEDVRVVASLRRGGR